MNEKLSCEDFKRVDKLGKILSNAIPRQLLLQFMKKNNHSDVLMMKKMMSEIDTKNSITHGTLIASNALMNAFTTNDSFLRDNLDWVAKATNWNRFSATASVGVIHQGNTKDAEEILLPYINGQGGNSSPYSTAGAYYAYGIIHANNYSDEAKEFLMNGYRNSGNDENIQHGVSLGLGLVSMGTQ